MANFPTITLLSKLPLDAPTWSELLIPALTLIAGVCIATCCGSWAIGRLMSPLERELDQERAVKQIDDKRGFEKGGRYIGYLERLMIFLFVITGNYEGVGFLVAAKSVFRFGELSESGGHNRMEAEYITIGTLLSFGWGFAVALGTKSLMEAFAP